MKRLIILFIVNLLASPVFPQGISFRSASLDEALRLAGEERKLVFVDCFTTWCAPCIYMTNNVFSRKEAGDFFNKHFINVMFDMEQEEGMKLGHRYAVTSYPTYLVLAPDGEERYRVIGRYELQQFIERISRGLDEKNTLPVLEKEYASGNMTRERVIDYLVALDDARRDPPLQQIFNEQMSGATLDEKTSLAFWPLMGNPRINPHSVENARFVFDHLETFRATIGDAEIDTYLHDAYNTLLTQYLVNKKTGEDAGELVTTLRGQLAARPIPDDALRCKLDIAEALARQQFDRVVILFGENITRFSLVDFEIIMGIFNRLDRKDKALMEKVAVIPLDGITDPTFKLAMRNYINYFISSET
ncbi:MAG: thioredoxin family protein [Odoribacteraceae bacterium]|jgi:thiol-disulfide isomerase/thioredoxin|nr:thioredoxin family protein [Odoribacteraceae bacterium]